MFEYSELKQNITNGETSQIGYVIFDEVRYKVRGQFSHRWSRRTVDGRLATDNPHEDITFMLMLDELTQIGAIERKDYRQLIFEINEQTYGVRNSTGDNPITFYLVPRTDVEEEVYETSQSDRKYAGKGDIV